MNVLKRSFFSLVLVFAMSSIGIAETWYQYVDAEWFSPITATQYQRDQNITIGFVVWTLQGPVYGFKTVKMGDHFASTWITVANGSDFNDPWATSALLDNTVLWKEAGGTGTVLIHEEASTLLGGNRHDFYNLGMTEVSE